MTHDEMIDLLGAYALDAVDDEERDLIDLHLLECPRCRAEVAEHREVASLLAHSGSDAPPGLWDRIVGTLDAAPPPLELAPVVPLASRRRTWLPTAVVAAAAVLLVAVLGLQVRHQSNRIDRLQAAVANPLPSAFDRALADPASHVFDLKGSTNVRVVVTSTGTGYLRASSLPRLASDRTYQLWGRAGDRLVSLGVLGNDPSVVPFPAGAFSFLAVTVEQAGGVVQSSNNPVVAGSVA